MYMLKQFQIPLGLFFSYSVFEQLLLDSQRYIALFKALLANSELIAFIGVVSNHGAEEATTLLNIDIVLLSLTIGFLSSAMVFLALDFLIYCSEVVPSTLLHCAVKIANKKGVQLTSRKLYKLDLMLKFGTILIIYLLIIKILQAAGNPHVGSYASWGSQLLSYSNVVENFANAIFQKVTYLEPKL